MNDDRRKLDLPDRRATTYEALEERLDECLKEMRQQLDDHVEEIHTRLRGFFIKALAAFAVIGIISAASLLGFGLVLSQENDSSAKIQMQRYGAFLANCNDQNERHDRATRRAERLLRGDARDATVLLIDELAPFTFDCEAYARDRLGGS